MLETSCLLSHDFLAMLDDTLNQKPERTPPKTSSFWETYFVKTMRKEINTDTNTVLTWKALAKSPLLHLHASLGGRAVTDFSLSMAFSSHWSSICGESGVAGEELGTFAVHLWLKQGTCMQHVHTPSTHAYPRDPFPYHETQMASVPTLTH